MNDKDQKSLVLVLGIALLAVAIIGGAFAFGSLIVYSGTNTIQTGVINFSYTEPSSNVSISQDDTVSDNDGKVLNDYFEFTVSVAATGTVDLAYYIYVTPENGNTLASQDIKIYLSKINSLSDSVLSETQVVAPKTIDTLIPFTTTPLVYSALSNNLLLHTGTFSFNNEAQKYHYYRLRIWLDSSSPSSGIIIDNDGPTHSAKMTGGNYQIKVNVYGHNGDPVVIVAP